MSLGIAYNYFTPPQFEGWEAGPTGPPLCARPHQEESSSAFTPSLMADLLSLGIAYNYFTPPQLEGWEAGPTGPLLGASSPAL